MTVPPVVGKSLKRSREVSGLDDEGTDPSLVLPPLKRRKLDLEEIMLYKSPRFVLTTAKTTTPGRPQHGLPSTRRFVQTHPKSQATAPTMPPRAEPARVSPGPPACMLDDAPTACGFTIYEETKDEEDGNLLTHSAQGLDISDDEISRSAKNDRGMENMQPSTSIGTPPLASPSKPMADKQRTPLGGLQAEEYFANDCDVGSAVLVTAQEEEEEL